MTRETLRNVCTICNRLVKHGYIRACAMSTAWRLVKAQLLSVRVAGVSFGTRQDFLHRLCTVSPAAVSVTLQRDSMECDANAVAVKAACDGSWSVIGYLPRKVAAVVSALLDKGFHVAVEAFHIAGGWGEFTHFGARLALRVS